MVPAGALRTQLPVPSGMYPATQLLQASPVQGSAHTQVGVPLLSSQRLWAPQAAIELQVCTQVSSAARNT